MPDEVDRTLRIPRAAKERGSAEDPLLGRSFGSYKVVKLLGEGGMGAVYLGEHPLIGSKVAIKMLHARYADDTSLVERFFNEARAVNLIGHENIVQILDLSQAHGRYYFVMEFLSGTSLEKELQLRRCFSPERAGPIVLQCCEALAAAHQRGIIHRDLKPDNVFLIRRGDRGDFVKLVDFGIAKLTEGGGVHTQAGLVLGTPAYMSPEQGAGDGDIDARSDIYSLGVVLFRMVTGRLPFDGLTRSNRSILLAHLRDPPPPPRSIKPDLPEEIEALILRSLEKDPDARFESMTEMHAELSACMDQLGLSKELPFSGAEDDAVGLPPLPPPRAQPTPSPRSQSGRTPSPKTGRTASSPGTRRIPRKTAFLGLAGVVLAAAAVGVLVLRPAPAPAPAPIVAKPRPASVPVEPQEESPPAPIEAPAQAPPSPAPLAQTQTAAEEAPAATPRPKPAPRRNVRLRLASSPESAFVAVWKGGVRSGRTPMEVEVPKGAEVHIRFQQPGYAAADLTVTAAADRVLFQSLPPAQ
jgi:serine/threonine-protein kinase